LDKGLKIGEFNKKEVAAKDIIEIVARGRVLDCDFGSTL